MLLENISLFWNLKTNLHENMGYLIHLFFFFSDGHLSTHCFKYLGHLSIFSQLFFLFFMSNFCIAHASFLHSNCWRDSNKNLEHLCGENLWSILLVFSPSVGVKYFWVDLDRMAYCYAFPQCRSSAYLGGVYVILILRAWQTSHKGQQGLTKLNAKQVAYEWKFS